jgi:hypothetical protein
LKSDLDEAAWCESAMCAAENLSALTVKRHLTQKEKEKRYGENPQKSPRL